MKKLILIQRKKKVYKILGKFTAAALLFGMAGLGALEASAADTEAAANQTVTYVYHQHIGSSGAEGGCYHELIYHTHSGNEAEGGACYQTPVYHTHTGDEVNGGECYGTPVLHVHTGNSEEGGGCFVPLYHKHTSKCYKTISSEEYGCSIVNWWDTNDGDYEGNDFKYFEMSCGVTVHGTNSSHGHTITVCNKSGTIEGYELGCGKTEESADSYSFDCEKIQGVTIDSYLLSCEKTKETVDGYGISCGMDEETPYGEITVTEQQGADKKKTAIAVSFKDLSGGKIQLSEEPFVWQNKNGSVIGTGDHITVTENGSYSVTVGVVNEDVKKESLQGRISINSIIKPQKDNGNKDDGNGDENKGGNDNGDGNGGDQDADAEESGQTKASPSPSAAPAAVKEPKKDNGTGTDSAGRVSGEGQSKSRDLRIPAASPVLKSETKTVTLPQTGSQNTEIQKIQETEIKESDAKAGVLRQFFESPAVQVITITAGALLALAGLLLFIYLLRMSVRLYNDDGEGRMVYIGRCRVRLKAEGYTIEISDAMAERAVTNRYCIKLGLFRAFRGEEEEIIVCRMGKRISVNLSKEMIVVI